MNSSRFLKLYLPGALVFFKLSSPAHALTTMIECDTQYASIAGRFDVAQCYFNLVGSASADAQKKDAFERAFITLSAIVNILPGTPDERKAVDLGLKSVEDLGAAFPGSGEYDYWHAVWLSFDAKIKDREELAAANALKSLVFTYPNIRHVLSRVESDLVSARKKTPSTHFYGPSRVLGIIYREKSTFLGGNKVTADAYLSEALKGAPRLSANWLAHAQNLLKMNRTEDAKVDLQKLTTLSDDDLNPYPGQKLRFPSVETRLDRRAAADLLAEIKD